MRERFRAWGLQVALHAQWIVLLAGAFAFVVLWPFVLTSTSLRTWQLSTWTLHSTPDTTFDWLLIPAGTDKFVPQVRSEDGLDYLGRHCSASDAIRCNLTGVRLERFAPAEHLIALDRLTTESPGKAVVIASPTESAERERWRSLVHDTPAHGASLAYFALSLRPMGRTQMRAAAAAYLTTVVYVLICFRRLKLVRSRTGLAVGSAICTIVSSAAVWIPTVSNCPDRPPPMLIPFAIWVAETENLFRLTNAVTRTPRTLSPARRVSEGLYAAGPSALRSQCCNVVLALLFAVFRPHMSMLSLQVAIGLGISFALHLTFFCAILAIDVRRTELMDLLAERHTVSSRLDAFFPVSTNCAATVIIFVFLSICDYGSPSGLRAMDVVSSLSQRWHGMSTTAVGAVFSAVAGPLDGSVAVLTRDEVSLASHPALLRIPYLLRRSLSARFLLVFCATMGLTFALVRELTLQADRAVRPPRECGYSVLWRSPDKDDVLRLLDLSDTALLALTTSGRSYVIAKDGGHGSLVPIAGRPPRNWLMDRKSQHLVGWRNDAVQVWSLAGPQIKHLVSTTLSRLRSVHVRGDRLVALSDDGVKDLLSGETVWPMPEGVILCSAGDTIAYVEQSQPSRLHVKSASGSITTYDTRRTISAIDVVDAETVALRHIDGLTVLSDGITNHHRCKTDAKHVTFATTAKSVVWHEACEGQVPTMRALTRDGDQVELQSASTVVVRWIADGRTTETAIDAHFVTVALPPVADAAIYKARTRVVAVAADDSVGLIR